MKQLFELVLFALVAFGAVKMVRFGFDQYYRSAYPIKYASLVEAACEEKDLDPALVYAVIRTESGFDPNAVSEVGARGLMQMMPSAFEWVQMRKGVTEPLDGELLFDPGTNIEYGTSMLKLLLDEFGSVDNALCAYHAGWGSVKKWLENPEYTEDGKNISTIPYKDTSNYVAKVKKAIEMYNKVYDFA